MVILNGEKLDDSVTPVLVFFSKLDNKWHALDTKTLEVIINAEDGKISALNAKSASPVNALMRLLEEIKNENMPQ